MNGTSGDAAALPRPPAVLLAATILIFLSFLLAGAEWWSDRQGYDWTIATMIVPQMRHPAWDSPVKADGSVLNNPAEASQFEAANEASNRRYDVMTTRKVSSVVLIGVMFVAGFGCGLTAWNRMLGRRWSRGAALLCVVCRNAFMFVMFAISAGFAVATDRTAFNLLVTVSCFSLGFLIMAFGYSRLYRALRTTPNGTPLNGAHPNGASSNGTPPVNTPPISTVPEIPLPPSWQAILAAILVATTALFIGGSSWLAGKQREQRAEADRLSMESAAIAEAFAADVLKSGQAKYANRQAWKQAHPFDRRYD